jgi:hypothetical protein
MSQQDYTRIRVDDFEVGLMGLTSAIEEIASTHQDQSDDEVQQALLERLRKKNYIPSSSAEAYGKALVREFRKYLGQAHEDSAQGPLRITALGPGCSLCDQMVQTLIGVLNSMDLPASFEHVTDVMEIAGYGFLRTPALIINDKVVCQGSIPSAKQIRAWLTEATASSDG